MSWTNFNGMTTMDGSPVWCSICVYLFCTLNYVMQQLLSLKTAAFYCVFVLVMSVEGW